ncbi:MAG: bifunctional [glutamine synthetase] adenylyltransferase/[glutamine synthetase]-adenylyl-L-tyrosine phosphorylase [Pseudomonadota bacterium]
MSSTDHASFDFSAFAPDQAWSAAQWPQPSKGLSSLRAEDQAWLESFSVAPVWLDAVTPILAGLAAHAPYLYDLVRREPDFFAQVLSRDPQACFQDVCTQVAALARTQNQEQISDGLRIAKRRGNLIIALADLSGVWRYEQVVRAMTQLAEVCVRAALDFLFTQAARRGEIKVENIENPITANSGYFILAMGKLGAQELNFSSDIDLVIFYQETEKRQIFLRITRAFVKIMEDRQALGYVYRVDLRLRPDPRSTPVAICITAAQAYYDSMAQSWERAAMMKARFLAGDANLAQEFLSYLAPFLWRSHFDFSAIEDIGATYRRVVEYHQPGEQLIGYNLKLGAGGIRQIEFLAQAYQMVYAGRQAELQTRNTSRVLRLLARRGHLKKSQADRLIEAYRFLRTLEHRLQMTCDAATHSLPTDGAQRESFARLSGFTDWPALAKRLSSVLATVQQMWLRRFGHSKAQHIPGLRGSDEDPAAISMLKDMGIDDANDAYSMMRGWFQGSYRGLRTARARRLLDEMMPGVAEAVAASPSPRQALGHFDQFLSRMTSGVPVLSLLQSNPRLIRLLVGIFGSAPGIASLIARHPSMLDVMLSREFFDPLARSRRQLQQLYQGAATARDIEAQLEVISSWVQEQRLRAAVHILEGTTDARAVGRFLALISQAAIRQMLVAVRAAFTGTYGRLSVDDGLVLVALGGVGQLDVSLDSDLDLLAVYTDQPDDALSDGTRQVGAMGYFGRLTQRFITAMTMNTGAGSLFSVDMRLRPYGADGPWATSLRGLTDYLARAAHTWERMAFTRARVIAGSPRCRAAVRAALKGSPQGHTPATLRADALAMRAKIAKQYPPAGAWDVRYRAGGLFDITFAVQFLQLMHPAPSGVNIHEAIESLCRTGRMTAVQVGALSQGYETASAVRHFLSLLFPSAGRTDLDTRMAGLSPASLRPLACLLAMDEGATLAQLRARVDADADAAYGVVRAVLGESS